MALRIGIDLDGVLADMHAALAGHADRLFGPVPSAPEPPPGHDAQNSVAAEPLVKLKRQLTPRQQRRLWRHVRRIDGFWESLEEIEPGIVARLATVASQRCWEIIFLTKRPPTAGATAQVQSQRWLVSRGFELPSVFVVTGSRGLIATALSLDVVVDDRPENCLDIAADSTARIIAIVRPPESTGTLLTSSGIEVVDSMDKCLKRLLEIDRVKDGVIERVLRKFGLIPQSIPI